MTRPVGGSTRRFAIVTVICRSTAGVLAAALGVGLADGVGVVATVGGAVLVGGVEGVRGRLGIRTAPGGEQGGEDADGDDGGYAGTDGTKGHGGLRTTRGDGAAMIVGEVNSTSCSAAGK
ncbi:hypothetical protein GCM10027614_05300 [Micromonospora vulcania]